MSLHLSNGRGARSARARRAALLVALLASTSTSVVAAAPGLVPRVWGCELIEGQGSPSDSQCGGDGFDNDPATQNVVFEFQLRTDPCGALTVPACLTAAKQATSCIDICYRDPGATSPVCPADAWCNPDATLAFGAEPDGWLFYSTAHQETHGVKGNLEPLPIATTPAGLTTDLLSYVVLPDTVASSPAGRAYFIRTNRAGLTGAALTTTLENGACYRPGLLAGAGTKGLFEIWGPLGQAPTPNVDQFGAIPGFDPCTKGLRMGFVNEVPLADDVAVCTRPEQATMLRTLMEKIDDAQQDRLQGQLGELQRCKPASNGTVGGVCKPTRIFTNPHPAFGQGGPGRFYMFPSESHSLDPVGDRYAVAAAALDVHRLAPHEYFHQLQGRWGTEHPASNVHINGPFAAEQMADAVPYHTCLFLEPAQPQRCTSAVTEAGRADLGDASFDNYLNLPAADAIKIAYVGAAFYRYLYEQFAYPVGSTSHPAGTASTLPRSLQGQGQPTEVSLPTQGRPSDEGSDLVSLLFQRWSLAQPGDSTLDLVDTALRDHLGRSLRDVLLDVHATYFLKDYNTFDPRWRLEWVGQGNSAIDLETLKPFASPASPRHDGRARARRVLDQASISSGPGGGLASTQPSAVTARGAAGLSVKPAADWVDKTMPVALRGYGTAPRVRIFRVARAGTKLTPVPWCGAAPDWTCDASVPEDGSSAWSVDQAVPIDADTDEVLVVVSALAPTTFDWVFGGASPHVDLVSPTASNKAFLGHPAGVTGKLPLLLTARYRDEANKPIQVSASSSVAVRLPGCATAPACDVPGENIKVFSAAGGNAFVSADVPDAFFPGPLPAPIDLDVQLVIDGVASGVNARAVTMSEGAAHYATSLVLDASGSMEGDKIEIARAVSKVFAASLVPAGGASDVNELSIVTFRNDAQTLLLDPSGKAFTQVTEASLPSITQAIDGIQPGGSTSIGDGLFEAASNFAKEFDPDLVPMPDNIAGQRVVVVSDGQENETADVLTYALGTQGMPTADGDAVWASTTLGWTLRSKEGKTVPVISGIGVGQDADLTALQLLTSLSGGALTHIPDGVVLQTKQLLFSFASNLFHAANAGSAHDRVFAVLATAGGSPKTVVVEPGTKELRVLIAAEDFRPSDDLDVTTPAGAGAPAIVSTDRGKVYKWVAPAAGVYRVRPSSLSGSRRFFVEAAVQGGSRMLLRAVAPDRLPSTAPYPGQTNARAGVVVLDPRGYANDTCVVTADVTHPSGAVTSSPFKVQSGAPGSQGSGTFVASLGRFAATGLYESAVTATCTTPFGTIQRESLAGFAVATGTDADGDGMSDAWERAYRLSPAGAGDAGGDPDNDGLTNRAEALFGTDPNDADSDHGGESDLSETEAGRDPLDPGDDTVTPLLLTVWPGADRVALHLGTEVDLDTVEIQSNRSGAYAPLAFTRTRRSGVVQAPAAPFAPICYRARRTTTAGATTGWSEAGCAAASPDPIPPVVVYRGAQLAHGERLWLANVAFDEEPSYLAGDGLGDSLGIRTSGVVEIRLSTGTGAPGPWQAYGGWVTLPAGSPTVVFVEARDGAGNVSLPVRYAITRDVRSALDQAIGAEEGAVRSALAGRYPEARQLVAESLPRLVNAKAAALRSTSDQAKRRYVVEEIVKILVDKALATIKLNRPTSAQGVALLRRALDREYALTRWAETNRVEFRP